MNIVLGAREARQRFAELLGRVGYGGEVAIIERSGKPMVAVIPVELYEQLVAERKARLQVLDRIQSRLPETPADEIAEDLSQSIVHLLPILSNASTVSLAYLFGSQVDGTIGPMSDIDLAILFEDGEDTLEARSKMAHELGKELGIERIDIVSLREAPVELAYGIISQGICIYQRDDAQRVEFEVHILSRYGDYLPVLRSQRREILEGEGNDRRVQRYREALRRTERTLGQIRAAQG